MTYEHRPLNFLNSLTFPLYDGKREVTGEVCSPPEETPGDPGYQYPGAGRQVRSRVQSGPAYRKRKSQHSPHHTPGACRWP
jgi:hypothetical protein